MSNIERFENEGRAAMRNFYQDLKNYVDHTIETIDTADRYSGAFKQEILRRTASTLERWKVDFDELARKQQNLENKINKLSGK
jgi:hypothetical protein